MSLILESSKFTKDIRAALREGVTQGELETMDTCQWKWYLKYVKKLSSFQVDRWDLLVGGSWHAIMEEMYATKGKRWSKSKLIFPDDVVLKSEDEAYSEYWENILDIYAQCYADYYKDDFQLWELDAGGIEQLVDLTIEYKGQQIRLKGKLDLKGRHLKARTIADHKTAKELNATLVIGWEFRFQFMFYAWLQWKMEPNAKVSKFLINAMRKPSIRVKQSETLPQFYNRLKNDIKSKPEDYFLRETLRLTGKDGFDMEKWERETLKPKLDKIAILQDQDTPEHFVEMLVLNRCTNNCYTYGKQCEYFGICQKGQNLSEYYQRIPKHPELVD